jgi:uncharacterized membrane protein
MWWALRFGGSDACSSSDSEDSSTPSALVNEKIISFFIFSSSFIFLIFLSLQRYFLFQLFYYDFGIFSQIIWQLSRFKVPYINHLVLGRIFFLGDHFNPSLVFLAPLYWLTSHQSILLLEQGLVTFFKQFNYL